MDKIPPLALLIGGIILIVYGAAAADSIGSGLSRMFAGAPTNKTMWLLAGGVSAVTVGLTVMLRSPSP